MILSHLLALVHILPGMRILNRLLPSARHFPDSRTRDSGTCGSAIAKIKAHAGATRYAEALALVDGLLTTSPSSGELLFLRGATLFGWGRYLEAREALLEAGRLGLASAELYAKLGWSHLELGDIDAAIEAMHRSIAIDPNEWATHYGLGTALRCAKLSTDAKVHFEHALALNPDNVHCLSSLVACGIDAKNYDDAERWARRAIASYPENAEVFANLGMLQSSRERHDEAIEAFRHAEALLGASVSMGEHLVNYVIALLRGGRTPDAIDLIERVIPHYPNAALHAHYGLALLTVGRLAEGFDQYEFRWLDESFPSLRPNFTKPQWTGQNLRGRTILLWSEQGFGDFIQFIRYAEHVKALGATVIVFLREELRELAAGLPYIDRLLGSNEAYPAFDYYANLLSLPRVLGTDVDSIPSQVPYLRADATRRASWRERIVDEARIKVGIVWAGSPTHLRDQYRTLPFRALAPLLTIPGVRFYSLQKGPAANELGGTQDIVDLAPHLENFADTAAAISELDLVVGVDTSVVHLAGALGMPVWTMIATPNDWRWLEDREDTPWYPTMRVFRQRTRGDWHDVIERVKSALEGEVRGDPCPLAAPSAATDASISLPAVTRYPVTISRVAQTREGLLQYLPDDEEGRSIAYYGEYRQAELEVLAAVLAPGIRVVEIHAGIGSHTLWLSRRVGPEGMVFAYENDRVRLQILQQNLKSGRVDNVTVMRHALKAENFTSGASGDEIDDHVETIDELGLRRLDCIKITNANGMISILEGAAETVWRLRPRLVITTSDDECLQQAVTRLRDFGYCCWRIDTRLFNPFNFNRRDDDVFEGRITTTVIGYPEETAPESAPGRSMGTAHPRSLARTSRRTEPNATVIESNGLNLNDHTLSAAEHAKSLIAAGCYAGALALVDAALARSPRNAQLVFARGSALFEWGRHREASAWLLQAINLGLADASAYIKAGFSYLRTGGAQPSEEWMRKAVVLDPDNWLGHFGLGSALRVQGRIKEAAECFERALTRSPDNVDCLLHLFDCRYAEKRLGEAEECLRRAIQAGHSSGHVWTHLGIALIAQDRFSEAIGAFERAEHGTEEGDAHLNLGICLRDTGRLREAIEFYERHLPARPSVTAYVTYAHALLAAGRLREGWRCYEFRWLQEPLVSLRLRVRKPVWTGQDLRGKTILLRCEQGVGDVIQFIRYAPWVKALGAKVLLQLRKNIRELAQSFPGIDHIIDPGETFPEFDFYAHLMSLPQVFGTDVRSVPAEVPYLEPETARIYRWKSRLETNGLIKVGLVWAGDPDHVRDRYRSITLHALAALGTVEGVKFFSLQKGPQSEQMGDAPVALSLVDVGGNLRDFVDTAAVISQLDLLIGVDTSVVHLAGALAKPVWVLLPTPADWRWMEGREDSPWYPTMRLFRQTEAGKWDDVVLRVRKSLEECVAQGRINSREARPRREVDLRVLRALPPSDVPLSVPTGQCAVAETRAGIIQYWPGDAPIGTSIERYGEFLQRQLDVVARWILPGSTIIEAAAGIGLHSLFLASAIGPSGHLVLYENDPLRKRVLQQNLIANRIGNATLMWRAMGMREVQPAAASNAAGWLPPTHSTEGIDDLRLDALHWIKANDATLSATILHGAADTLWRLRPSLLLAATDEQHVSELAIAVCDFGYQPFRIETPLFNPDNFNRRQADVFDGESVFALLAFPEEVTIDVTLDHCTRL